MRMIFPAIAAFLACFAIAAQADPIRIDPTFAKANQWLRKENLAVTGTPAGERDDAGAFRQETILFYGEGYGNPIHKNPVQREGMAKRAAVVAAQRAVAEYLEGFAITSETLVEHGVTTRDVIRSATSAFVKGAQVVFQEYSREKDTAIAFLKIGMHGPEGFATTLYRKMESDPAFRRALATDKPDFTATPARLDTLYDGLIIDATGQPFRPALINRIFTPKGEVVYDPAKVSQKVLVERGGGEYTNSIDKARAALAIRGVKNPLLVKASGLRSPCDIEVSDEHALTIFSANQRESFLAGAKVAFVLK